MKNNAALEAHYARKAAAAQATEQPSSTPAPKQAAAKPAPAKKPAPKQPTAKAGKKK